MTGQYCFPGDSPAIAGVAQQKHPETNKLKTRVKTVTVLKHRRDEKHTGSDSLYSKYDSYHNRLTCICLGDMIEGENLNVW